jgi:hypothetical protein
MREVADRAQVAMSSVSRVLSEHPDVSPGTRWATGRIYSRRGCGAAPRTRSGSS